MKFVHTNLPTAGFELESLGWQANVPPTESPLLVCSRSFMPQLHYATGLFPSFVSLELVLTSTQKSKSPQGFQQKCTCIFTMEQLTKSARLTLVNYPQSLRIQLK